MRRLVVCEVAPKKKADSAMKRARQAEKRRIYNKAKKSEAKTRMRKVSCFFFFFNYVLILSYFFNIVNLVCGVPILMNFLDWSYLLEFEFVEQRFWN